MKNYKELVSELPTKTVVFAFGRFNPPTLGHELLIKVVRKLASQRKADHVVFASATQDAKKNPLEVSKKVQYLELLFPNTRFAPANKDIRTFLEAAVSLNKRYRNLVMVAGSDRVQEFEKILKQYNGKAFKFDTIEVVSAGSRDPDADDASGMSGTKMRSLASKGDYFQFKRGLPTTVRDIDGKRLMNDIRCGMGLEPIKEQINLVKDTIREQYFRGEIFKVGDIVESNGQQYEIIKRGSNHLLVKEESGKLFSKWIQDLKLVEGFHKTHHTTITHTSDHKMIQHGADFQLKVPTEHHGKISKLNHGEQHEFKCLDGNEWTVEHRNGNIHITGHKTDTGVSSNMSFHIPATHWNGEEEPESPESEQIRSYTKILKDKESKGDTLTPQERTLLQAVRISADTEIHESRGTMSEQTLIAEGEEEDSINQAAARGAKSAQDARKMLELKTKQAKDLEDVKTRQAREVQSARSNLRSQNEDTKYAISKSLMSLGDFRKTLKMGAKPVDDSGEQSAVENGIIGDTHLASDGKHGLRHQKIKHHLGEASAAAKLQKAFQREQERIAAERKAGEELLKKPVKEEVVDEDMSRRGFLKGVAAGAAVGAAGKAHAIAGAFPSPSTRAKWAKDAADSNAAESRRLADKKKKELENNTKEVDKAQRVNHHSLSTEETVLEGTYEKAEENKRSAEAAKSQARPFDYHMHMADHHDNMSQWHASKGRHGEADRHAEKSDEHHEKAMSVKESVVVEGYDDNRNGFAKKPREDDEYHNEPKPKFKAKSTMDRPHTVHIDGKPWKKFDNGHQAHAAAKTLTAKGKKATAIAHFREETEDQQDTRKAQLKRFKDQAAGAKLDPVTEAAYAGLEKEDKPGKIKTAIVKTHPKAVEVETVEGWKDEKKPVKEGTEEEQLEFDFEEINESEFDSLIESLTDEDILEAYEDSELAIVDEETGEELEAVSEEAEYDTPALMEVLSRMERVKAKARMRRTKAKRERAEKIALRHFSTTPVANRRARRLSVSLLKKRLMKGVNIAKASVGQKENMERYIAQHRKVVDRLSARMVTKVRQIEKKRLSHRKFTK